MFVTALRRSAPRNVTGMLSKNSLVWRSAPMHSRMTVMGFATEGDVGDHMELDVKRAEKLDYYTILRVKPADEGEEIKESFRKLAKQYHPDMIKGSDDREVGLLVCFVESRFIIPLSLICTICIRENMRISFICDINGRKFPFLFTIYCITWCINPPSSFAVGRAVHKYLVDIFTYRRP